MRDNRKNQQYWNDLKAQLRKSLDTIAQAASADGISARMRTRMKLRDHNNSFNFFLASYSAGDDLRTCRELYMQCLHKAEEIWELKTDYVDLIRYVSLGVLFGVNPGEAGILSRMVNVSGYADRLLCAMLRSLDPTCPLKECDSVPAPYDKAAAVLDMDRAEAENALVRYLNKDWYLGHRTCLWYDEHKRDDFTYLGYWSFEAAALVKILGLYDRELAAAPYYPPELAD